MQLSLRLKTVADSVTGGSRVADVGCDHAYIAIHLAENNIAPRVIAMDVNKGPLSKARENIELRGLKDRIETRLSDGLARLTPGEADTVVIAGMGGALMARILTDGEAALKEVKELILQPQSEIFLVRRYLHDNGYRIESEKMVKEDEKYYIIIKAVKDGVKEVYEQELFYLYGKKLLESGNHLVEEFLLREGRLKEQVEESLKGTDTVGSNKRLEEIRADISLIHSALKYFRN
ncbi:MAG: trmK [Anaerocolumna sp.]|jgi:tRNA (adenine22-N1)-methyltransferase|nr:trmK [Anaerocolumna sp.]